MAVRDVNTPTQCQVACSHQPECKAFTFIVGGPASRRRRCWLKKAGYVRMASTGTLRGVRRANTTHHIDREKCAAHVSPCVSVCESCATWREQTVALLDTICMHSRCRIPNTEERSDFVHQYS
eukprot:4234887-Prymnesium_polylepis.1